jgi:DNA-binding CsgD family transcriptional regulator
MKEIGEEAFAALKFRLAGESDFLKLLHGITDLFGIEHAVYHLAPVTAPGGYLPFVRTTYSPQWIMRYITANYVAIDPVVQRGMTAAKPFFWSDVKVAGEAVEAFFRDAAQNGVGNCGYTHPVAGRGGRRAIFTLNGHGDQRDFKEWLAPMARHIAELALILHKRALAEAISGDPVRHLSRREIECLNWIARGKDAATIADILEISEHTVRDYLKSARTKLDCSTVAQAVYEATRLNLIQP